MAKYGGAKMCLEKRLVRTRQTIGTMKRVWASSEMQMSINLKVRFFLSNFLSVYGFETSKKNVSDKMLSMSQVDWLIEESTFFFDMMRRKQFENEQHVKNHFNVENTLKMSITVFVSVM